MNMVGQFAGAAGMSLAGTLMQCQHSRLLFLLFAGSYFLAAACWLAVDVTRPLVLRRAAT